MTDYRRLYMQGGCYFFTLTLQNRQQSLLIDYIDLLRSSIKTVKQSHPFSIDAIVILPEHLHCILSLPENDDNFSMRWRQIKAGFSRQLPVIEEKSRSRIQKQERGIWQRRFWEHLIRNEQDFNNHMDYIYFNPVKHGWVDRVVDWKYSSFHRDVKEGLYTQDWGSEYTETLHDIQE